MMYRSIRCAPGLAIAIALALSGCGRQGPGVPPLSAAATPVTSASEADAILDLLDNGKLADATKRLRNALKHDAMNPSLRVLDDSIGRDPKELLGPSSYPYTVRAGDTITGLAERFLGNRLKAYQLARYNGIAVPSALAVGQQLRIPGEPRRAEPSPAAMQSAPPARAAVAPRPATPAPPPAPPVATANPAAARSARAAGLAALNEGKIAAAVALLSRAQALDPANPLIARDLARAQRIAATVKARR